MEPLVKPDRGMEWTAVGKRKGKGAERVGEQTELQARNRLWKKGHAVPK